MQAHIASGQWIKLVDTTGKVVARAYAQTGSDDKPNDPHWVVIPPHAPTEFPKYQRVATEEVAASVLAMIAVTHSISAS